MSAQNMQLAKLAIQGLSQRDRSALLRDLTGQAAEAPAERLLRRAEVARRLACSLRLIDLLAARGQLTRIKLPGRQRGNGFLESEVSALLAGKGGTQ